MQSMEHSLTVPASSAEVAAWWQEVPNWSVALPMLGDVSHSAATGWHCRSAQVLLQDDSGDWQPLQVTIGVYSVQFEWRQRLETCSIRAHWQPLDEAHTRVTVKWCFPDSVSNPGLASMWEQGMWQMRDQLVGKRGPQPYVDLFYRSMAATAGVAVTLGLVWSLVALIEVWVIAVGALMVGATLSPTVAWLERHGIQKAWAVSAIVTGVLLVGVALGTLLLPTILLQGQEFATALPSYIDNLSPLLERLHKRYPMLPNGARLMETLASQVSPLFTNLFSMTGRLVWYLVVGLSILFLGFFALIDGHRIKATMVRVSPYRARGAMLTWLGMLEWRVGRYMAGLVGICGLAGTLTWATMWGLGVPDALLIGAVTALLQGIPLVGPLIAAALAGLLALSVSAKMALWALLGFAVIQQLIGQWLFPWLMGRSIGMHPAWVALVLLVGATLYGLTGAFLAIPVAIALSSVLECFEIPWTRGWHGSNQETKPVQEQLPTA